MFAPAQAPRTQPPRAQQRALVPGSRASSTSQLIRKGVCLGPWARTGSPADPELTQAGKLQALLRTGGCTACSRWAQNPRWSKRWPRKPRRSSRGPKAHGDVEGHVHTRGCSRCEKP